MSTRSLTCCNLLLILSLLVSLVPQPAWAGTQSLAPSGAAAHRPALDSPLPPPPPPPPPAPEELVQLRLSVAPETADPGDKVTYTFSLTNTNAVSLTGVVVNAVFVPALTYQPGGGGGPPGTYDPDTYTLSYPPIDLAAGAAITLTFRARLARDAAGDLPCSVYLGPGDPADAPSATAIVHTGGGVQLAGAVLTESGSGEGLDAGWQLLYNPPAVSTFSGAATYNYPLELPAGRNGVGPSVNLSYSSRAVDGTTWWVDSDWVGLGWSIDTIDVTRRGVEYCWDDNLDWICLSENFSLLLNGTSYLLTPASGVPNSGGRYYAENAPGLRVERYLTGGANDSGQYWTVHTPDGTRYRLGFTHESEQKLWRVYGMGDSNHQVYRWRVDEVRDVFDNQMIFQYVEYTINGRNYASYPSNIYYNNYGGQWATRVQFVGVTSGDAPGDRAPILRTRRQLNGVKVWHLGQLVREYALDYQTEHHGGAKERTLTRIEQYGSGGESLPATTLVYQDFDNKKWELGAHQDHCKLDGTPQQYHEGWATMCQYWGEQFPYPRLVRVENGYGGVTALTYSDPIYNGSLPEKHYPVEESQSWDGVTHVYPGDVAASRTSYEYSGRCWDSSGQGCDAPGENSNKLMGFGQTTVRHQGHEGSGWETLASAVHQFDTGSYWTMGRETRQEVYEGDLGTLLRRTQNTYTDSSDGLPSGIHFVYLSVSRDTVWQDGQEQTQKNVYQYNPGDQGGVQYGNRTRVYHYDQDNAIYRHEMRAFYPNPGSWIVNEPAWSAVFDQDWNAYAATFYHYDGQSWQDGPGDEGRLTLTRARRLTPEERCPLEDETVDTSYTYDAHGNLKTATTYAGYGWVECDASDVWTGSAPGDGSTPRTTTTNYDSTYDLYPLTVTNAQGQVSHSEYYGVGGVSLDGGLPGQVRRVWGANGEDTATRYVYDDWGRLTEVYRPGDAANGPPSRAILYHDTLHPDWRPLLIGIWDKTDPDVNWDDWWDGVGNVWTGQFYDGLGRPIQTHTRADDWTPNGGAGEHDVVQYTLYDALGRASEQSVPYEVDRYVYNPDNPLNPYHDPAVEPHASQPRTTTVYDALGRVVRLTNPDGTSVQTEYDGWRTTVVDARGNQKVHEVDAFGRLETVQEYDGASYNTTTYAYDRLDNLNTVTDALGNVTTMTYDALRRKTNMDDPDMGDWSYIYNPAGSLELQTDARGCSTDFDYDALERLTSKSYSGPGACAGTPEVSYSYDEGTNGIGHRSGMSDGSGSTSWSYDTRGRMTQESKVIAGDGGGTFLTQWDYDALDRVAWIKYPGGDGGEVGEQVSYTYNSQGLLQGVSGQQTYVQSSSYDAAGRVELRVLGNDVLRTTYEYYPWTTANGLGRLKRLLSGEPSNPDPLQDLHYTYDAVGNVETIQDSQAGGTQTQSFTYDALDRLERAQASGGSGGTYSESYAYDAIGNLRNKGGVNYTYPASGASSVQPHAVSSTSDGRSLQYDANGNQTQRVIGGSTYNLTYVLRFALDATQTPRTG